MSTADGQRQSLIPAHRYKSVMVSCYDCDLFSTKCVGIVPPIEYRDRIDEYCPLFTVVSWRTELFKPEGKARIS